jgi:hypothetical protein
VTRLLYRELATLVQARKTCAESATHQDWFQKHSETIKRLVSNHLAQYRIDLNESHADKLVFYGNESQFTEDGVEDGYTSHTVIVKPSLTFGFTLRITGHDRNDVKEHIAQLFNAQLREDVTYDLYSPLFPELQLTSKWEDKEGNPSQCYQAFYVQANPNERDRIVRTDGTIRFWNDLSAAKKYAGEQAYNKFMNRAK